MGATCTRNSKAHEAIHNKVQPNTYHIPVTLDGRETGPSRRRGTINCSQPPHPPAQQSTVCAAVQLPAQQFVLQYSCRHNSSCCSTAAGTTVCAAVQLPAQQFVLQYSRRHNSLCCSTAAGTTVRAVVQLPAQQFVLQYSCRHNSLCCSTAAGTTVCAVVQLPFSPTSCTVAYQSGEHVTRYAKFAAAITQSVR